MRLAVIFSLALVRCSSLSMKQDGGRKFPSDFLFGTATAAYQIEGGWNADDKSESIWDHLTHTMPDTIRDRTNGDVAADTYNNYKRDVEMLRELGVDAYRLSLSWSRILPDGLSNKVSEAGVAFYNNYIDEMIKYNITPMVTLYHWDLPQRLQDWGGFMNPSIADWFEDYARVAFENFGDRVKHWITFNEPREICYGGYAWSDFAPRLNATGIGDYVCAKNLVIAHAKAYRAYVNEFKESQGGVCGITISIASMEPLTDSEEDEIATEFLRQASWGIYAEPIFSEVGGFPQMLAERVAEKSKAQGYSRSRMPEFTEEEKNLVRGTYDFFGVNHYSGEYVSGSEEHKSGNNVVPSTYDDIDIGGYVPDDWPESASSWLKQAPDSIYKALIHLKERYNNPVFYITENGWSTYPEAGLVDDDRVRYYRAAWDSCLNALDAGVNLQGYMAWSLMDNFEWMQGYVERFGLYQVDFEDPARTRTPRKSAFVYKHLIQTRTIDLSYEPDISTATMSINEGH